MERIKKEQILSIAATKTGLTLAQTKDAFDAIFEVVEESLLAGYGVKLGEVGYFKLRKVNKKPERMGMVNVKAGEKGMLPAVDEYNAVAFKINSRIRKELKAKTLGNLFEE